MSIGSFGGVTGSAAGAPLPATQGGEAERAQREAAAQSRGADYEKHAQKTAGIGHAEEDQEASDRDADGRRPWERPENREPDPAQEETPLRSKDATGEAGNSLDLTG